MNEEDKIEIYFIMSRHYVIKRTELYCPPPHLPFSLEKQYTGTEITKKHDFWQKLFFVEQKRRRLARRADEKVFSA